MMLMATQKKIEDLKDKIDDDDIDFPLTVQATTIANPETFDLLSGFRLLTRNGGVR